MTRTIPTLVFAASAFLLIAVVGFPVNGQEDAEEGSETLEEEVDFYVNLLDAGNPYLSDWSRQELIDLGSRAVPSLMDHLDGPDARVRFLVAEILGHIGDDRAREALVDRLADGGANPSVASVSARALGKIGDPASASAIREALQDTSDTELIYNGVWALGNLRDKDSVEIVRSYLDDDRETFYEERISAAALSALGKLRAEEALPDLREFLLSDRKDEVESGTGLPLKFYAVRALEQIALETRGSVMVDRDGEETTVDRWLEWLRNRLNIEDPEEDDGEEESENGSEGDQTEEEEEEENEEENGE